MNKTKIDWCDSTWNPVTGCLHGCEYCYARGIAERFGGWSWDDITMHDEVLKNDSTVRELDKPLNICRENGSVQKAPYPYDFIPTLHRYHLNDYKDKKGRNIFACSMADLFGEWVPDEWIEEVFKACENAPQHNYLFLTKNPKRYIGLCSCGKLPKQDNFWYGQSITKPDDKYVNLQFMGIKWFLSIEPLLAPVEIIDRPDWVIIGAETGRRKDKIVPDKEWVASIAYNCICRGDIRIPVFMKSSLADIWGEQLIQEFPEELRR